MPGAARALLTNIVDYAGLFPPAGLGMADAVKNYAEYLGGPDGWMLGRFVVPASRLDEFEAAAVRYLPARPAQPWLLSALGGDDLKEDVRRIGEFNCRHAADGAGAASVDAIELRAGSATAIDDALSRMPAWLRPYVELPLDEQLEALVGRIAERKGRAKVRTGGVTADAFPRPDDLLRFVRACVAAAVPFKATAGLHHPLRGSYRLTYDADASAGTMYGFLNVFLTTALIRSGASDGEARALLTESSAESFSVDRDAITWRGHRFTVEALTATRAQIISFGSCSFREPVDEAARLGFADLRP